MTNATVDARAVATIRATGVDFPAVARLNFLGTAIASAAMNGTQLDQLDLTINSGGGGGGGYATVQGQGSSVTARTILNFGGTAFVVADNSGATRTDVTLSTSPSSAPTLVGTARQIITGNGLTGGGDLSADRTHSVLAADTSITVGAGGVQLGSTLPNAFTASGVVTFGSQAIFGSAISPTALSGNVNDYAPSGLATANVLRQDSTGNFSITGLTGGVAGRLLMLDNLSTSTITLTHQDASSAAANRFDLPGDVNMAIGPGCSALLIYDGVETAWLVPSQSITTSPAASPVVVGTTRQVASGTGLSGGGALSSDLTLSVLYGTTSGTAAQGNDSRITGAVQNTRNVNTTAPITGGGALSSDLTLALTTSPSGAATVVGTARTVSAGNGLTGGGDLSANRMLTVLAADTSITVGAGGIQLGSTLPNAFTASGVVTFGSQLVLGGTITPAALSGTTNDYAPSGLATANVVRQDFASNNLTGLTGGVDGRVVVLENISTTTTGTLTHEDAGSAAANRFTLPTGQNMAIGPRGNRILVYDGTSSRWRQIGAHAVSPVASTTVVGTGRLVSSGNGLSGGGDLSADRTLTVVAADSSISVSGSGVAVGATLPTATTFSAAGTALTVTNNASVGGTLLVSGLAMLSGGVTASGGALSLTGNAASSLTTSSGGLTLTGAAASTWSTSAGALTLTSAAGCTWSTSAGALTLTSAAAATWSTSAGALTVNGFAGLNLQQAGSTAIAISSTGVAFTQPVVTSGNPNAIALTAGAHTTLTAAETNDVLLSLNRTVQFTAGTTIALQRAVRVRAPTYSATGAQTITNAATVSIDGAPSAGTNVTITNGYAFRLEAGNMAIANGNLIFGTAANQIQFQGGNATIAVANSNGSLTLQGNQTAGSASSEIALGSSVTRTAGNLVVVTNNGTVRAQHDYTGGLTISQGAATTGTAQMLVLTGGAHTGQTASTEISWTDVNPGTVSWATGAIATQRCARFRQPTLAFTAASTVTSAATLAIDNAPAAGSNATITNAYALWVQNGATRFDGTTIGFLGAAPVAQQTSGANLTNNVTSGGTNDTIANFTDLAIYSNDAATIRNDIFQLARKLAQVNNALRLFGLLT